MTSGGPLGSSRDGRCHFCCAPRPRLRRAGHPPRDHLARADDRRPADGRRGPYEMIRGRIHGEVDPDGSAQRDHPGPRARAAQRARPRRVRRDVRAGQARRPVAQASGVLLYSVVNRGNGEATREPRRTHLARQRLAGRRRRRPRATRRSPCRSRSKPTARRSPVRSSPGSSNIARRHEHGRHSAQLDGRQPAGLPAGDDSTSRTPTLTSARRRKRARREDRHGDHRVPRATWAFADCRTHAVPGHARSDAALPQGRLRSEPAVRARLHGEGSAGARRRSRRHARHRRRSSATRRQTTRGTPNPVAGAIKHAIAIGDSQSGNFIKTFIHLGFNQDLQGRIVWDGVVSAHRGAADADELPLRAARRRRRRSTSPAARPSLWWSALRRHDARTRRRRACSIAAPRRRRARR